MAAHFAVVDTAPGWTVVALVVALAALYAFARWAARMWHQSGAPLTATIEDVLSDPDTLCGHLSCTEPAATTIHGWRVCKGHANELNGRAL